MYGNFVHATNDASHYTTPPTYRRGNCFENLYFAAMCYSDSVPLTDFDPS